MKAKKPKSRHFDFQRRFGLGILVIQISLIGNLSLALSGVGQAYAGEGQEIPSAVSHFIVHEGYTLKEVSLYLYGTTRYSPELQKINELKNPDQIFAGMKLKLAKAPTLTPKEGHLKILEMWRKRFALRTEEDQDVTPRRRLASISIKSPSVSTQTVASLSPVTPGSEKLLKDGESLLAKPKGQKDLAKAAQLLSESRSKDPRNTAAWLKEIHTLKTLQRTEEARASAEALIKEHPTLRELPSIKSILKNAQPSSSSSASKEDGET